MINIRELIKQTYQFKTLINFQLLDGQWNKLKRA